MENISDIKKNKCLNFILPTYMERKPIDYNAKIAVIIHLYYQDTLKDYYKYIEQIPEKIDIFVTVSDRQVYNILEKSKAFQRKNLQIIQKQNRGRDISSFLVACREKILEYEYICFVHDKKEKSSAWREDTRLWVQSLWENMIDSRKYIANVWKVFMDNPQIGLLVPPPPMSVHNSSFFSNTWFENFALTKELADKMELNCDLDSEKSPLTIGTAFWARVSALKKLFDIEWKYEDFDEEPLKDDGTISHVIERILPYVAQDAGYETGWVMTDRYASEHFEYTQDVLIKAFERLSSSLGIWTISELDSFECRKSELLEFVNQYDVFYIYGAGKLGKGCFAILRNEQKIPAAFLVSDINCNPQEIEGIPVYAISNFESDKDCGIIVAVGEKYQNDVLQLIQRRKTKFSDIFLYKRE